MSIEIQNSFQKKIIISGIVFLIIGIALGAFGAHTLKEVLSEEKLNSFETGVRYQIYHGISLIVLSYLYNENKLNLKSIYYFMFYGIIFFSFSIYLLTIKEIINLEIPKIFGLITPIGGFLIIISWILLLIKVIKIKF